MSWGGLNNALTAWRTAVMLRFPGKDTASDGARADAAHSAMSQHQADADGTVDAYDCDDDLRCPQAPAGSAAERRLQEAMKLDFEQDPHGRGKLWIHNRKIANRDVDDWLERSYGGQNPHDKHIHFESRQAREDDGRTWPMPHTDAVLRGLRGDDDVNAQELLNTDLGKKGGGDTVGVALQTAMQQSKRAADTAARVEKKLDALLAKLEPGAGQDGA